MKRKAQYVRAPAHAAELRVELSYRRVRRQPEADVEGAAVQRVQEVARQPFEAVHVDGVRAFDGWSAEGGECDPEDRYADAPSPRMCAQGLVCACARGPDGARRLLFASLPSSRDCKCAPELVPEAR